MPHIQEDLFINPSRCTLFEQLEFSFRGQSLVKMLSSDSMQEETSGGGFCGITSKEYSCRILKDVHSKGEYSSKELNVLHRRGENLEATTNKEHSTT
jgi:hypothetical protein